MADSLVVRWSVVNPVHEGVASHSCAHRSGVTGTYSAGKYDQRSGP